MGRRKNQMLPVRYTDRFEHAYNSTDGVRIDLEDYAPELAGEHCDLPGVTRTRGRREFCGVIDALRAATQQSLAGWRDCAVRGWQADRWDDFEQGVRNARCLLAALREQLGPKTYAKCGCIRLAVKYWNAKTPSETPEGRRDLEAVKASSVLRTDDEIERRQDAQDRRRYFR